MNIDQYPASTAPVAQQFQTDLLADCAIDWSRISRLCADSPTFEEVRPLLKVCHDAAYLRGSCRATEALASLGMLKPN